MQHVIISPNVNTGRYFPYLFTPNNYSHKLKAALGYYDTCSFDILGSPHELQMLFSNILSRDVRRFAPDGNSLIFEGFVNRAVLTQPRARSEKSLENMYNRISVRYTKLDTSSNPPGETEYTTTTKVNDTDSQGEYGIKELVFRPPAEKLTQTSAEQIRDVALEQYKVPRRSDTTMPGNDGYKLQVQCLGYIHTLKWRIYNQTVNSGTQNASTIIGSILDGIGDFIDTHREDTNGTQTERYFNDDDTALSIIQKIASVGDNSNNRWIVYVDDNRHFVYEKASSNVKYIRRLSDRKQAIRTLDGRTVPAWAIRPNTWMITTDAEMFSADNTDITKNPRAMYIESVEWLEDRNSLVIQGSIGDEIKTLMARVTAEGEAIL
ncbi:MAG: hypothetical protein U9N61_02775 [Euryarchaeota archaeon]|nr:hypothetical protein [Euryarchaeota archaeon]